MKPVEDMTEEELRAELTKILARKAKRGAYQRESRWEKILRDPKAYYTRRKDWDEDAAERNGWDLSKIPKLNSCG